MPSNAISFQGSKLYIGSGTSGAKNITAITKAYRAEVTSAAHGLSKGDRVTFASVGGMTEINAKVGTVIAVATDTFVVDIDTRTYTTYTSGGTATPVTWVQVKEIKSARFAPAGRSELTTTNLDSDAEEFLLGLKNNGSLTGDCNIDLDDAGQTAFRAGLGDDTVRSFKVELATGKICTFSGLCKNLTEGGAVNAVFDGSYEIKISGDYSWA